LGAELVVTLRQPLAFVRRHGVVLEAATGPVPSLAFAIVGAPIRGSWWAHPRSHGIFEVTRGVQDSENVLVCRLIGGKIKRLQVTAARLVAARLQGRRPLIGCLTRERPLVDTAGHTGRLQLSRLR
jgi:hypothetical protein